MKLADFGTFVIFTALYAAGTLGLPKISLLAYQVRVGEIPSAFVAIFGWPAVLGLTLGQFLANLGVEASPIAMLSPIVSLIGLAAIYYSRKFSTLLGCMAYVVITTLWLSVLLSTTSSLPVSVASYSVIVGQLIAVMIGYVVYVLVTRTMPSRHRTTTTN